METLPKKAIVEAMEACTDYRCRLKCASEAADASILQIQTSAVSAIENVESAFKQVTHEILLLLGKRKQSLLRTIDRYTEESILPLKKCKEAIQEKDNSASNYLTTAEEVLRSGGFKTDESYQIFMEKSSELGSLPAVPEIEFVPNITFQVAKSNLLMDFEDALATFGSVFKIGPVQLSSIEPQPGSLLVRWEEVDCSADVHSYRLQKAYKTSGVDAKKASVFSDVYIGCEPFFLVRDLTFGVEYSFRVCCRSSDRSDWSSWSRIKSAQSDIRPFLWSSKNPDYIVSDEGKLARMIKPAILYSSGPLIVSDHFIQFIVTNISPSESTEEGIALCSKNSLKTLMEPGVIFVAFNGKVLMDGLEKRISMPAVEHGDKITLQCQMLANKWRITIEVRDKAVTYDWNCIESKLYFAARLQQPDTHIFVH